MHPYKVLEGNEHAKAGFSECGLVLLVAEMLRPVRSQRGEALRRMGRLLPLVPLKTYSFPLVSPQNLV